MIAVTRLDKKLMYLNPDHIICIEETPDTVITLFNGNRYIVVDRVSAIISRIIAFRAKISRRASFPSVRRHLGRPIVQRIDWAKGLEDEGSLYLSGTEKHTPFHSRDF
jgi:flagellar protein FlbD